MVATLSAVSCLVDRVIKKTSGALIPAAAR
jgi:hypothetical protein